MTDNDRAGGDPAHSVQADDGALAEGRRLFAQTCGFVTASTNEANLPEMSVPEIAFAGRSNVGKSSLVNALTGRKTLARTSNTPGRTQQLNFFDLGSRLMLVDLPGYGFARASKSAIKQWTGLTRRYLKGRANLRRVCLLIDARHGIKDSDKAIMAELDGAAVSYQAVLTKSDKLKTGERERVLAATGKILARHPAAHPEIAVTSAVKGEGLEELRATLAALQHLAAPPATD